MSFLGDLFGGKPRQVGTQVTTTEPPAYALPYLEFGLEQARDLYDTPKEYYSGDTYTPFGNVSTEALGALANRARSGNSTVADAENFVSDLIGGDFKNAATGYADDIASGDLTNSALAALTNFGQGNFGNSLGFNTLATGAGGGFQNAALNQAGQFAGGDFGASPGYSNLQNIAGGGQVNPIVNAATQFSQGNFGDSAGFNALSNMASGQTANEARDLVRGVAGGNFDDSAYSNLQATARGDFLTGNNPYLEATLAPIRDQVNSIYARGGRLGSGANAGAVTSALAPVLAQNYENERARQLSAINTLGGAQSQAQGLLGNLAATDLGRGAQAANVLAGAQTNAQNLAGQLTNADLGRQLTAANALGGAQSSALGLQGQLSASDITNRLSTANNLASAQQNALNTQGAISSADLNRQLAGVNQLADISQTDLANRFTGADASTQFAANDYNDIRNLLGVGSAYDAKSGEKLASDIARFNFTQNEPDQRLANYLSAVSGGSIGSTTTAPIYGNPLGQAFGNLNTGAQAAYYASKAFPNLGSSVGSALSGLGSLLKLT